MLAIFCYPIPCDMRSCDRGYHKSENLEVFLIGITLLRCDIFLSTRILHIPGLYQNGGAYLLFYDAAF